METLALTRPELEKLVETIALEVMRRLGPSAWMSEELESCSAPAGHSCGAVCMNDQPAEVRALACLLGHTTEVPQEEERGICGLAE